MQQLCPYRGHPDYADAVFRAFTTTYVRWRRQFVHLASHLRNYAKISDAAKYNIFELHRQFDVYYPSNSSAFDQTLKQARPQRAAGRRSAFLPIEKITGFYPISGRQLQISLFCFRAFPKSPKARFFILLTYFDSWTAAASPKREILVRDNHVRVVVQILSVPRPERANRSDAKASRSLQNLGESNQIE
jgi:hypothetical protein